MKRIKYLAIAVALFVGANGVLAHDKGRDHDRDDRNRHGEYRGPGCGWYGPAPRPHYFYRDGWAYGRTGGPYDDLYENSPYYNPL